MIKIEKIFVITAFIAFMLVPVSAQTITNPLTLTNEWSGYSIGDPYVFKFNGVYYLYCSTKDGEVGIKCWSSKNLVSWQYRGLCSTDAITESAYAPEVKYWNGKFYMCTSPAGNGHYILSSDSATGPFTVVTSNLGHSIDGDVFIDDDGKWYFYHAGSGSIVGCSMSSPTTIGSEVNLNVCMCISNNWTEGPSVVKRNGVYYMIYTGNHVWSKGYRIGYAMSTLGPISGYTTQDSQNPIIINSEGTWYGLGHGTLFVGPDLDTYYITYHNFGSAGAPVRHLNFDRVAWNGDKMMVLGPTNYSQQAPFLPDAFDYFNKQELGGGWILPNGGKWSIKNAVALAQDSLNTNYSVYAAIMDTIAATNFTAEFNMKEVSAGTDARFGAIFCYTDEQNYGMATLNSASDQVEVCFKVNNVFSDTLKVDLPTGYDFSKWHDLRIEKAENSFTIFVDNMLKGTLSNPISSGKIGYLTKNDQSEFGYIAFSNKVNGSGIFDVYKPLPGTIAAVHYNSGGEGVGYHDLTSGNTGGKYTRNDSVDISECSEGGMDISSNQTGEWYKYNVKVLSFTTYNLGLRYNSNTDSCKVRMWMGDTDVSGIVSLPSTAGAWRTSVIRNIPLESGNKTLKLETVSGEFDFQSLQFVKSVNTITTKTENFNSGSSAEDWNYIDGTWVISDSGLEINGYGKRALGYTTWSNYVVETDVKYLSNMNGGLIFRVNNPSLGGAGDDPQLGTDFYQGYFVGITSSAVVLGKQNYSWAQLASASGKYVLNTTYHIKVVAKNDNIKIYINGSTDPVINYTDINPIISGKVGLRSYDSYIHFDNFSVTTFNDSASITSVNDVEGSNQSDIDLYPNPAKDKLVVSNTSGFTDMEVLNAYGQQKQKKKISTNSSTMEINVNNLTAGAYLIKLTTKSGSVTAKWFLKIDQ